jgi:DNA uptake protein ComE-like DNA-binding protein
MSAEGLHSQNTIANILHQFKVGTAAAATTQSNQGREPSSSSFRTSTSRSSEENSLERVNINVK